jgi:beta-galactosidase/beta-glucuronidase
MDQLHPRPQLTRSRWIDLSGTWQFAYDDDDRGLSEAWQLRDDRFNRTILVPFPPEAPASGIGDPARHPVVWYRRTFTLPEEDRAGRLLLHFGAVDYRARVWVNGQLVATHEGGHTPFSADISAALLPGDQPQALVVRAEDQMEDLAQPRGKQDWQPHPHAIWYPRTTGIWQPVWLEPVPEIAITSVRWTPIVERGAFELELTLSRASDAPLRLAVQLSLSGEQVVNDSYEVRGAALRRTIDVAGELVTMERGHVLWSPEHPNLFAARLTLLADDNILDTVGSYAGLRSAAVAPAHFLLNGQPYYLRMVLDQGYWPESHLAAPSPDALRREVELIKALGFNGVRVHQKIEDPRFLYWCDRLGLLVWGEMPSAYRYTATAAERLMREWTEVLRRDYSHPCIVTWVPLNESWGVPDLQRDEAQQQFVRGLYHLTRALDPGRPVIANDGWEYLAGDMVGIHDYALDGGTLTARYGAALPQTLAQVQPYFRPLALPEATASGRPALLSEFGGLSYTPRPGEPWHGYGTVDSAAAFLDRYRELVSAVLASPLLAGFCYTQLTDVAQETNGLLDAQRRPKLDVAAIAAINLQPAQAIPGEALSSIHQQAVVLAAGLAERRAELPAEPLPNPA